jgi:regulator of sigma E protease
LGILISIGVLSVLVIIHELGHFLTARFFGVKVEEFGLGLPIGVTKPWFARKYGDTVYSFYPVFLGGFVKMKGQDDSDPSAKSTDADSYGLKNPYQKMAILFAGPFANFLFAFVLYFGVNAAGVEVLTSKIGQISQGSAAFTSGMMANDKIISIDGKSVSEWKDIQRMMATSHGESVQVALLRDGKPVALALSPKELSGKNIFGESIRKYMIGIAPSGETMMMHYSLTQSGTLAFEQTYDASKFIVQGIQKLFTGIVSLDNVGGIVSIVQVTSDASKHGLVSVILLAALISVNLGVVNLLPIPALDGGHIVFNMYEALFRRAPNENLALRLTYAGWAFLLALMILGLYNDVGRLAK